MGVQIQHTQAIEDRLWAVQVLTQANVGISEREGHPIAYEQGCQRGFKATFHKLSEFFGQKSAAKAVWVREDIKCLLLGVRAMIQQGPDNTAEPLDDEWQGFQRGSEAALWAVATCFGVNLLATATRPTGRSAGSKATPWFLAEDVKNMVVVLEKTLRAVSSEEGTVRPAAYYEGFEAALGCVAQSFGTHSLSLASPARPWPPYDYWFHQAVEDEFRQIFQAAPPATSRTKEPTAYSQGFRAALRCISLAFGLRNLS
jgi:hypothetical protein